MGFLNKLHDWNLKVMGPAGKNMKRQEKTIRRGLGLEKAGVKKSKGGKGGKSSKKKSSHGGGGGGRSVLQEGRDSMKLMQEITPQMLALEKQYGPEYARAQVDNANARAEAEKAGVESMGTGIRDAIVASSPEIAKSAAAINTGLDNLGPTEIEKKLTSEALDELNLGGGLTADEIRNVNEGSRAAWSARGLGQSQGGAVEEVMNRSSFSNQRKDQRRAFASGVNAQTLSRKSADQAFSLNAMNTSMGAFDPYQRMYGNGGSQQTGAYAGQNFESYLSASQSVAASNQQAALAREAAAMQNSQFQQGLAAEKENYAMNAAASQSASKANNKSAMTSAGIRAAAMILAAFI